MGPTTRTVRTTPAEARVKGAVSRYRSERQNQPVAPKTVSNRQVRRKIAQQKQTTALSKDYGPRSGPVLSPSDARRESLRARRREKGVSVLESAIEDGGALPGRNIYTTRMSPYEGNGLVEAIDLFTGIPTAIKDPSGFNVAMAGLTFVPFARIGAVVKALVLPGRVGKTAYRVLSAGGQEALLPAAQSWLGRGAEELYWQLTPYGAKIRRVAKEKTRTAKTLTQAQLSPATALADLGKQLRADQQVALRLWAEGKPVAEQLSFYERAAATATDSTQRAYLQIHANLIRQASKYLAETPNGPVLSGAGRGAGTLKRAQTLLANKTREDIYKSLGLITEETIIRRLNAPGRKIGEETFQSGKAYVPYKRGVPGLDKRRMRNLTRQAQAFVNGGWRRSISQMASDPSLRKAFTGALMDSGFFRTDVTNLSAEALAKATKIAQVANLRKSLLASAVDEVPLGQIDDYIAIKVDPSINASPELKAFWDRYEEIGGAGMTRKELERELRNIAPADAIDRLAQDLFPVNASPGDPNIKWVDRRAVDAMILNPIRRTKGFELAGDNPGMKTLGIVVDAYNDLQRAAILYLNPAYGPVNMLGNTAMALMQQGIFLPRNIIRAAKWAYGDKITPENLAAIQEMIQVAGLTGALGKSRTIGTRALTGKVSDWVSFIVDRGPRWTAFVQEANRAGIKTEEQLNALIDATRAGREDALTQLDLIKQKTNRALVDFDNLNPFERQVMTRVVFFYPWLKGASVWTKDFAKNHPYQAAALAAAAYGQDQYSDRVLGDRPWYAQFDTPIPGLKDERGNPYVFNPRQLLTPTTPIENAASLAAFASGQGRESGAPQLIDTLTPGLQNVITAFTGRNDFGQDVGQGFGTFVNESWRTLPPARMYQAFTTPYEEKQDRMYPRTTRDELIRLGLGGLAPKPYSISQARKQAGAAGPTKAESQSRARGVRDRAQGRLSSPLRERFELKVQQLEDFPGDKERAREALAVEFTLENRLDTDPKVSSRNGRMNYWAAARVIRDYAIELFPDARENVLRAYRNANTLEKRKEFYTALRAELRKEFPWSEVNAWLENPSAGQ